MFGEAEIFSEQKQSGLALEGESLGGWLVIPFSGGISTRNIANSGTLQLGRQCGWNAVIDQLVQRNSRKWFTSIEGDVTDSALEPVILSNERHQFCVLFDHKRDCSLNVHTVIISLSSEKSIARRNFYQKRRDSSMPTRGMVSSRERL